METSTSTSSSRTVGFARNQMTGVSQIYLQENWLTGVLMVVGFAIYSVPMALLVVIGTCVATSAAHFVERSTAHGLQGYCGALVGAASWITFGEFWPALFMTLVGAAACPTVTGALASLFGALHRPKGPLPVLTAPFCIISGFVALMARAVTEPTTAETTPPTGNGALLILEGILTGIGQVVFSESWVSGLVILVALLVADRRAGAAALMGSTIGTLTAWAFGSSPAELANGLAGYNPALTAIAVAVTFLRGGPRAWLLAVVGALLTVGLNELLGLTPLPVYTWPFILGTWIMLLIFDRERA